MSNRLRRQRHKVAVVGSEIEREILIGVLRPGDGQVCQVAGIHQPRAIRLLRARRQRCAIWHPGHNDLRRRCRRRQIAQHIHTDRRVFKTDNDVRAVVKDEVFNVVDFVGAVRSGDGQHAVGHRDRGLATGPRIRRRILAAAAVYDIVTAAALDDVVAIVAGDLVVAGPADDVFDLGERIENDAVRIAHLAGHHIDHQILVGAGERQRIVIRTADIGFIAATGRRDQRVVAGAAVEHVVATGAGQNVALRAGLNIQPVAVAG